MSAPKYYSVVLPCKPYIKKFLSKLYGSSLLADHGTALGCYINLALEKSIYENRHTDVLCKNMTTSVIIQVNRWQFERLGFDMSREKVIMVNRYLEESFQEALYMHCVIHTEEKEWFQGYKEAILKFAEKFNILVDHNDEDITYDGLKKIEYRHRKKVEAKLIAESKPVQGQLFF